MKEEKSIVWKSAMIVAETIIGGTIGGVIFLALLSIVLPIDSVSVKAGAMDSSWWAFLFVFIFSYVLSLYLGTILIDRKAIIHSPDVKTMSIILGIITVGAAYINFNKMLVSLIIGIVVAACSVWLLNKKVSA